MDQEILHFWFEELEPANWWQKDENLDRLILTRFAAVHGQAARCELFAWRSRAEGRLAEIIVLDRQKERDRIIRKLLDADEHEPLLYHALFNNGKSKNRQIARIILEHALSGNN